MPRQDVLERRGLTLQNSRQLDYDGLFSCRKSGFMDKNVLAAMTRWPNVPDVFGWLSLSEQGHWRLHPQGDAASRGTGNDPAKARNTPGTGEPISSSQIRQFIDHNYARDPQGRWYFQNGPQRVFVRLDAAPYILRTTASAPALRLQTHNGLDIHAISGWWLDDSGRLYAQTEHGPGLVAGRDLMAVLESLYTTENELLTTLLERSPEPSRPVPIKADMPRPASSNAASAAKDRNSSRHYVYLNFCASTAIAQELGFVCNPGTP